MNVIISFLAREDKVEEFESLMGSVKSTLPEVHGCSEVKIFRDLEQPCAFTLVETWSSQALHAEHLDQLVASGAWEHISQLLQTPPTSRYCDLY